MTDEEWAEYVELTERFMAATNRTFEYLVAENGKLIAAAEDAAKRIKVLECALNVVPGGEG